MHVRDGMSETVLTVGPGHSLRHGVPVTGKATVISEGGSSNRYRAGTRVTLDRICGHRDGDATSCPGEALYAQLPAIRRRAAALARDGDSLTFEADATEVFYPDTVVALLGTLRFPDGATAEGAPVQIQYQSASGSAWTLLETLYADAEGGFTTTVTVSASGWLRAVYPGDSQRGAITAPPVPIEVRPALTLSLDPWRVPVGDRVSILGTVDPPEAATAEVVVHRWTRTRRKLVWRSEVPVVDGMVQQSFKAWRRGRYRITLKAGGSTIRRNARSL